MKTLSITLYTSFLTYVQSYWQELRYDYRTLIGVESGKSDVKIPSKNSAEEQNNV